jgi:hypothetical protein
MFWTKMDLEITLKQDRIGLGNKLKKILKMIFKIHPQWVKHVWQCGCGCFLKCFSLKNASK